MSKSEFRPRLSEEEYNLIKAYRDSNGDHTALKEQCDEIGIPFETVSTYWYKGKNYSIKANPNQDLNYQEVFERVCDEVITDTRKHVFSPHDSKVALHVIISDQHVGMNPNPNGVGIFGYEYNATIYAQSMNKVFEYICSAYGFYGHFDEIVIFDLGDMQDGWNGKTTRGGHELQQNMTNSEVFETCLKENVRLIESVLDMNICNKLIFRSVTNSNHSSDFSHICNIATATIINRLYSRDIVEVDILNKFIEARTYGEHTFLITHGKDSKHMKRGFPLVLDDKTINYVNNYLDHFNIKSKYVHFYKGDLHSLSFQRTKRFTYTNFASFAPPSDYIQTNFPDGYSGFSLRVVPKNSNDIGKYDIELNYKPRLEL
jgi:hypothetical protein